VRSRAPVAVKLLYKGIETVLMALLFSFLIQIDARRLMPLVAGLRSSRLSGLYEEAAEPLSRLAASIAMGLRAQMAISAVNTVLTAIGLALLGLPSIAMLAVIVFVCGLVPVLGLFVSIMPILLIAINVGGAKLILATLGMIFAIHLIESYLLNPLIYGAEFKFNPVLTLIILFVAYHAFGIWGMLLGLPVARYLIRDVFKIPLEGKAVDGAAELPTGSG